MDKKLKIVFAPGCFDNFEGTQEELDQLVSEIQQMLDSGELLEKSRPLDLDELIEEDPELAEKLLAQLSADDELGPTGPKRILN